jgi:hypothetical protein
MPSTELFHDPYFGSTSADNAEGSQVLSGLIFARRMSHAPATQTALPMIESIATYSSRTRTPSSSAK